MSGDLALLSELVRAVVVDGLELGATYGFLEVLRLQVIERTIDDDQAPLLGERDMLLDGRARAVLDLAGMVEIDARDERELE
ncbi:hypothetical protein [Leucobacter tenebrionis]|uniref:hypothetical protein n=1 Tax=Leucobacter tenebrionis TaxID=2873270 RepID=UPI001CA72A7F|nr:hypothetical protein [Leucobacter tenebrionis]QZY50871.1 hypothetical protein KVY00_09525 [Leucobacter tenebrionis]